MSKLRKLFWILGICLLIGNVICFVLDVFVLHNYALALLNGLASIGLAYYGGRDLGKNAP